MFQRIIYLGKTSFALWSKKRAASRGAAIAFYTVTSIAPIILLVIAIAGLVYGEAAARGAVFGQLSGLLGAKSAGMLQSTIAGAAGKGGSIAATAISVIMLLLSVSGVFVELEDAVNDLWDAKQEGGITGMAKSRLISLGLVIGLGFVLIVSLVVETALKAFTSMLPFGGVVGLAVSFVVSLALTSLMFSAILKFVPQKPVAWRDVWIGGVVTAVLFEIGKLLLGIYLGRSSSFSSLGAAGALIALLIWIYYTAQIFMFGAAFTRVYAEGDKALADGSKEAVSAQDRKRQPGRQRELESASRR
ncbi:MAG TPA: YihY/virulence factor BrkB family protein [Micropepsaceae bacterium]|nr:YihY/virulence factor BrkB family protein [Micropepsaceae bacterium]